VIIARIGQFLSNVARHAVPVGGVFGTGWHPVTAMSVYWLESFLLVLGTWFLCVLMDRRVSEQAVAAARRDGDVEGANALEAERQEVMVSSIRPGDVFGFHVGSLLVFGLFFGGVVLVLLGNGHVAEPVRWDELREGAMVMIAVVAVGFLIDIWSFSRMSAAAVRSRVDACLTRWGLFWALGFFGLIVLGVTGRAAAFFNVFVILKITIETYGRLARLAGWGSMPQRNPFPTQSE
jgi:Family of unknown function (DUF6498)